MFSCQSSRSTLKSPGWHLLSCYLLNMLGKRASASSPYIMCHYLLHSSLFKTKFITLTDSSANVRRHQSQLQETSKRQVGSLFTKWDEERENSLVIKKDKYIFLSAGSPRKIKRFILAHSFIMIALNNFKSKHLPLHTANLSLTILSWWAVFPIVSDLFIMTENLGVKHKFFTLFFKDNK